MDQATDAYSDPSRTEATDDPAIELRMLQSQWMARIQAAEKDRKPFEEEAKRAIRRLKLDDVSRQKKPDGNALNIAYANYEVMRSTIYSRPPHIVIQAKFGGGPQRQQLNDVSEVIERAVESENERANLHGTLKAVRDELLKVGRGVPWARYEADFEEQTALDAMGVPDFQMPPAKTKTAERVCYDVVSWRDFLHGRAAKWDDVEWVAKRVRLAKKAVMKRFGLDAVDIETLGLTFGDSDSKAGDEPKNVNGATVEIYEVWCKTSNKVYFVAKGATQLIEAPSEPLINVKGFYPCPEPAMSMSRDGTLTPIPDIMFVEDQLVIIDELTSRMRGLEKALKVRGFYAKGATESTASSAIERAVSLDDDRQILIPVTAFAANGQSKLDIQWLPIDAVIQALQALEARRDKAMQLVQEINGVSDVMRGSSNANETLGAQQLKDRWGGVRVRDKQEEMRRVARDLCRISAEIICELFDGETISKASVYGYEDQMLEFMRDDAMRSFLLDVETDSTVQADEQEEKAKRTEFTTAIGGLIQQMLPVVSQVPEMMDFAGALIKFNVRGFRAGRELEKEVDAMLEAVKAKLSQPPPQPPQSVIDPATEAKTKAEMAKADAAVRISENNVAKSHIDLQKASNDQIMRQSHQFLT